MGPPQSPTGPPADETAWDRDCAVALATLLVAGSVTAGLGGLVVLSEVCGVLGGVFLGVAVGLGVAPRLQRRRRRSQPQRAKERSPQGDSAPGGATAVPPARADFRAA